MSELAWGVCVGSKFCPRRKHETGIYQGPTESQMTQGMIVLKNNTLLSRDGISEAEDRPVVPIFDPIYLGLT